MTNNRICLALLLLASNHPVFADPVNLECTGMSKWTYRDDRKPEQFPFHFKAVFDSAAGTFESAGLPNKNFHWLNDSGKKPEYAVTINPIAVLWESGDDTKDSHFYVRLAIDRTTLELSGNVNNSYADRRISGDCEVLSAPRI